MEVSYANSGALSSAHYRLVQSVETVKTPAAVLSALLSALSFIQQRWSKGPITSSSLHRDLLLALYCASQRPPELSRAHQELLDLVWCLENAVKLAGGDAKLEYRKTGYRVCDEVFTTAPHSLKLLLINSIRSDISAPTYAPQAPARWVMGLRAAASPRLAIPELVPAVGERLLEILSDRSLPPHLPRLALAALLNLLQIPCPTSETLLPLTHMAVLHLLSPSASQPVPSSSASSSSAGSASGRSSRHSKTRRRAATIDYGPVLDPALLAALIGAITFPSPLLPLPEGSEKLAPTLLAILQRTATEEWATRGGKWDYQGVRCGWLAEKALKALEAEVTRSEEDGLELMEVVKGVLEYVESVELLKKGDLAHGLTLSVISLLALVPTPLLSALPSPHFQIFSAILSSLARHLQRRDEPNLVLLGLKGLRLLDPSLWTGHTESDGEEWGERTWRAIMGGLENGEAEIRKETIRLLLRVDQSLVDLHFTRLLTSLKSLHSPSLSASAASSASRISTATPTPRQRLQARDRLLALLLEASAVSEAEDGVAWSSRVREIIPIASPYTSGPQEVLLPVLITSTIDRFTAAEPSVQAAFGRAMFEAGGWIESVNEGLVVAATVGMGELGQIATEERVLSIVQISEWLAGDGELGPPPALIEPFLLALLRLLAILLDTPSFQLSSIRSEARDTLTQSASHHSTSSDIQRLFSLLLRALNASDGEGEEIRSALRATAQQRGIETLVGFWEKLQVALAAGEDNRPATPTKPSHLSTSSDRPLRYEAYSDSLPPVCRKTSGSKGKGRAFDESARERAARGGRGGVGESLLSAGALALLGVEEGLQADSDEEEGQQQYRENAQNSEEEEEEEEKTTPMQRSMDEKSRSRERSSSEGRADSPPAELLIDLAASNPFHDGS